MSDLIVVEEEVSYYPTLQTREQLWQHVNQHFYGEPRVPLEVSCSPEHQAAAGRAIACYRFRVRLTYNEVGELVAKEFVE